MNCPKCGNDVAEGNFCSVCGHKLDGEVEQEIPNAESVNKIKDLFGTLNIKKAIIVSFSAILLAGLTAFGIMQYSQYQKNIKPISVERQHNNSEYNISYDSRRKQTHILITLKNVKVEQWQKDMYNTFKDRDIFKFQFLITDKDGNIQPHKIDLYNLNIEVNKPFSMEFVINKQKVKDFVEFKENIAIYFENKQLRYVTPLIFSTDITDRQYGKKQLQKLQEEDEKAKEVEKFYKEADSIASKWAFKNVGEKIVPIDFNPRKCLFNVKGICFGHPFFVHGMSYEDCKATSNITGILNCAESQDLYATNVYVCGGKKNMPTPDELVVLAHDMYNNNGYDNIIFNEPPGAWGIYNGGLNSYKGQRDNTKYYIEYFRNTYWTNKTFSNKDEEEERLTMPFSIISSLEENDKWIYGRIYTDFSTGLIATRRFWHDSNHYSYWPNLRQDTPRFSICVDRNMSTPLKSSYPVKRKDTKKDFENDLF